MNHRQISKKNNHRQHKKKNSTGLTYFSKGGNGYSYEFNNLVGYFKMYEELMKFWENKQGGTLYNLCYEELIECPEQEIKNILAYCGLDWESGCLNFHKHSRLVNTASRIQVRQRMYKGSSKVWRRYKDSILPLIQALE